MSPLVFDKMQGGVWRGGISIIALCPELKKLKNKHHFFKTFIFVFIFICQTSLKNETKFFYFIDIF